MKTAASGFRVKNLNEINDEEEEFFMSKIGVALALCVLLLGVVLYIGDKLVDSISTRGESIGSALTGVQVGSDGKADITIP